MTESPEIKPSGLSASAYNKVMPSYLNTLLDAALRKALVAEAEAAEERTEISPYVDVKSDHPRVILDGNFDLPRMVAAIEMDIRNGGVNDPV